MACGASQIFAGAHVTAASHCWLACQWTGARGEAITREDALDYAKKMLSDGRLRRPPVPKAYKVLLNRQDVEQEVSQYLEGIYTKAKQATDGKFYMLGCSGMKGIGKTSMLVHSANVLVTRLAQRHPSGDLPIPAAAIYLTFNGGGTQRETFSASFRRQSDAATAFGHVLLHSIGIELEKALPLNFKDCVDICRSLLRLPPDGMLCMFVDEAGHLDDPPDNTVAGTSRLFSSLMQQVDASDGKLAFVFAHIRQDVLDRESTDSGRTVIPLPLRALQIDCWRVLNPDAAAAAKKDPRLHQLLLACSGHPRSLVDGLAAAKAKVPNLFSAPTEANLVLARDAIATACKFNDIINSRMDGALPEWFKIGNQANVTELERDGLLLTLPGEPAIVVLHPLLMHTWAQRRCNSSKLAFHLQQAYDADCIVGSSTEKYMEAIMYHYEAVRRISARGAPFALGAFYTTRHQGPRFRNRVVFAKIPPANSIVQLVPNFDDVALVLEYLENGFIVVSRQQGEVAIEYLSPYVDNRTGKLIVGAAQCKFVKGRTLPWVGMSQGILKATRDLRNNNVETFPVLYTTVDQQYMLPSTYRDGVYFLESDLFDFTCKLGILRLHTEKLGTYLAAKYPWLSGAAMFSTAGNP